MLAVVDEEGKDWMREDSWQHIRRFKLRHAPLDYDAWRGYVDEADDDSDGNPHLH